MKVEQINSRITIGFYFEPNMITSLEIVLHHFKDTTHDVVRDQYKPALCGFLSYHNTKPYTDHLFTFSQRQRQQIINDVEFTRMPFVVYVLATIVDVSI